MRLPLPFYSKSVERFLAIHNIVVVLFVIVWKIIGLEWLPYDLHGAWQEVVAPTSVYYPRHDRHEVAYNLFFLVMYGLFGLLAQVSSLYLVANSASSQLAKAIFGAFHGTIATYHVLFASRIVEGKLTLMENGTIPLFCTVGAVGMYLLELWVAIEFSRKPYDAARKTSLDLLSFLNISPLGLDMILVRLGLGTPIIAYMINLSFFVVGPAILLLLEVGRTMPNEQLGKKQS